MRKVIAVVMMVLLVVFFYRSLQEVGPQNMKKKEEHSVVEESRKTLEEAYPENPIELVEIHNELINVLYNKDLKDEEVEEIVELQRQMYGKEFLDLNPIDEHIIQVKRELFLNEEKEIKIIGSTVKSSYNDPPGTMKVQVVHYTNKQGQDVTREYILEKEGVPESSENGKWKIYGWKDTDFEETQEDEQ